MNAAARDVSPATGAAGPAGANAATRERRRSLTPETTKIHVGNLSRNVSKEHVKEIFGTWGLIRHVEIPPDRSHPEFSKGFAYVEYMEAASVTSAVRHMNGGQIDGQEVGPLFVASFSSLLRTCVYNYCMTFYEDTFVFYQCK